MVASGTEYIQVARKWHIPHTIMQIRCIVCMRLGSPIALILPYLMISSVIYVQSCIFDSLVSRGHALTDGETDQFTADGGIKFNDEHVEPDVYRHCNNGLLSVVCC